MKIIPSIFAKHPWQWSHPCKHQPKTHSFRADDEIFKTVNSVFFDPSDRVGTNSSECEDPGGESVEMIIRGVQSERLIFEPGDTSSSILDKVKNSGVLPLKESVVLAMDSDDPYIDFKTSMEEMVETHGLKDWECLEELLGWYLRMNETTNHGFIIGAFVDLLKEHASSSISSCFDSTNSSASSFSSSRPSSTYR
ncbi:Transcription repressor OFP13 [Forsythia ovata]|uniref:Transcription repressor n=1 Tax=Forsythia ovata TaxID=205694 RepID=A0ABD1X0Y0_9LAMI